MDRLRPKPAIYHNPTLPHDGTDHTHALGEDIDSFNSKIMKQHVSPISHIYIDIQMLKDIYLGALLRLCTQDEYSYVVSNIDKYNDRVIEKDILTYFPEVTSVTTSSIQKYIQDTTNTLLLVIGSPPTSMYISFPELLKFALKHNSMYLGPIECSNITVCINTYPLPYSEEAKEFLLSLLKSLHPDFKLQYVSTPLSNINASSLINQSVPKYNPMFIYDFISFIGEDSTSYHSFVKNMQYFETQIYTPRRIDPELYTNIVTTNQRIDEVMSNTESVLSLSCRFKFIDISIPI